MYMAVTADKYELPLCVEDTARELGARFGVSKGYVYCAVSKKLSGKKTGYRFVKVDGRSEN